MDKDVVKEVFLPNTALNSSEKSSGMKRIGGKCSYCRFSNYNGYTTKGAKKYSSVNEGSIFNKNFLIRL
jgi:hypothetical protein